MTQEQLNKIIEDQKDLKNLPNNILIGYMDLLTQQFEDIKKDIIQRTLDLDKIEMLYNNTLNEYNSRT